MEYKKETIKDNLDEVLSLVDIYWKEADERREEDAVRIESSIYLRLEELGQASLVTARDDGELIGFIVYLETPCTHTGLPKITTEILFVKTEYRNGEVANNLIDMMEALAPDDCTLFFTLKTEFPHNRLVASKQYRHVENVFMKRKGKWQQVQQQQQR